MLERLIGLWLAAGGAAMLSYAVRQLWRARLSLDWPVVEAQILEKRVDVGRRRSYVPVVRYQYECGGRVFEGDRIIFSGHSIATGSQDEARRFADQFHTGMRIPIRVCPASPALSVIEPGFEPRWWFPLVFALGFVFFGLAIAIGAS
jgi:hypothetical protein